MNNLTFASPISPVLSALGREDLSIINAAIGEFFTPARGEYKGFAEDLMEEGYEEVLPTGLHATVFAAATSEAPSVLLVHGWGGNSAQLSGFVRPLLASGKRVVAVDMWAHGYSPGVESNCVKFAEGIAQAQAELGPFQHAIGHSLGAAAILGAAYNGLKFKSVVLISTPSVLWMMKKFLLHKGAPERLLEPFLLMSETYVGKKRTEADSLLISKSVATPMLLIHDEKDRRCPAQVSDLLVTDCPDRQLMKTHGYGHYNIIRAKEVIDAAVAYLASASVFA